jgi:uncharacterized protein YmfQ (DUF2313 family)
MSDICTITPEDYGQVAIDHLPPGDAWPREPGSMMARFWLAVADTFYRLHRRCCDLLRESFPPTAVETLGEWEKVLGLPDPCVGRLGETIAERQRDVALKLISRGGQRPAYYIGLARILGYEIDIVEHFPAWMGIARMGCSPVGNEPFWWKVRIKNLPVIRLRSGCGQMGEPICAVPNLNTLLCAIQRAAPAHTDVTFSLLEDEPAPPQFRYLRMGCGQMGQAICAQA